jgi:hypothetical protein
VLRLLAHLFSSLQDDCIHHQQLIDWPRWSLQKERLSFDPPNVVDA